jgi:hypothetical protein
VIQKSEKPVGQPHPVDVMGALTNRSIDIDKSGIVLATANRTLGYVPVGDRAQVTVPPLETLKLR